MVLKHLFPFLRTDDPYLGRLDYDSLTDQMRMEILFDGMDEKHKGILQDEHQNYRDVCDWGIITCTDSRVQAVEMRQWNFHEIQFPFPFLPPHIENFTMGQCKLYGTLETADLPLSLAKFSVPANSLFGTLHFKGFPVNLTDIDIGSNNFTGSCLLADLPRKLIVFKAYANKFSGELSLENLPPDMTDLNLYKNLLTGSVVFPKLPDSLTRLDMRYNAFEGDHRIDVPLPKTLYKRCLKQSFPELFQR